MDPRPVSLLSDAPALATYLARIGAEAKSPTEAWFSRAHGKYWNDLVRITLDPTTGKITTWDRQTRKPSKDHEPTSEEAKAILEVVKSGLLVWPYSVKLKHYTTPDELRGVDPRNLYPFMTEHGELVSIVVRSEKSDGEKTYKPFTPYNDKQWRWSKPSGSWPLFNSENAMGKSTAWLHEGPKAARFMRDLVHHKNTDAEIAALYAHPFAEAAAAPDTVHLGWHNGALNAHLTDWDLLRRCGIKNVIVVEDNDAAGKAATRSISWYLRGMNVFRISWTKEFPPSFDLADNDDWPKELFKEINGKRYYVGKTFDQMLLPATWATDYRDNGTKKPDIVLREEFAEQWCWCAKQDLFVNRRRIFMCYSQQQFDRYTSMFSDSRETSALLHKSTVAVMETMVYRPDVDAQTIMTNEGVGINVYIKPTIPAIRGNSQPFENFLDYLFPKSDECYQVKKWIATLISKPEIHMQYAILLFSETHGTGKTTLCAKILAPLVGEHNTSFSNERELVDSSFTGWIAKKRLVVCGEIYVGNSWKAYHLMKERIGDPKIRVNEKYVVAHDIENWAHFIACSNSPRALKIDNTDRRWLIPEVTESRWGKQQFTDFYHWLGSGGINIIKQWADDFVLDDFVQPGDLAPMTERKQAMIDDSMSDAQKFIRDWHDADPNRKMVISDRAIRQAVVNADIPKAEFATAHELRSVLKARGWVQGDERIAVKDIMQYVLISPLLVEEWKKLAATPVEHERELSKIKREWLRARVDQEDMRKF